MAPVTIACAQLAPRLGDVAANAALTVAAIARAVAAGADLVVLPELATSGYVFAAAEEARRSARVPEDALGPWVRAAREHDVLVVGGFAELGEDGRVYNSAAIVAGDGPQVVYRKVHLWDREQLLFTAGDVFPPVVDTPLGRLGLAICYDLEFPEIARGLALRGAEVLCLPTNWPSEPRPPHERPIEVVRAMASASMNRMFVAACDRCGRERGVDWVGGSVIVGADGWLLAGPAGPDSTRTLLASCDLARARDKTCGEHNDVLADRREDVYRQVTGDVVANPAVRRRRAPQDISPHAVIEPRVDTPLRDGVFK